MKKLYSTAIALLIGFGASAQISLQGNDTIYTNGPASEFEIVAYANIMNTSENSVNLRWVKLENNLTTGWASTVCDINACYPDNTDSADFELNPRAVGNIDGHFYPNNTVGSGTLRVRVYEVGNPSNQVTVTFIGSTNGASASNLTKPTFKIYPVPAVDYVTIETTAEFNQGNIQIFNAIGKKVGEFSLQGTKSRVSVGHLPKGQYLIRLESNKGLITKSFIKH